jgi:hypothetical protein
MKFPNAAQASGSLQRVCIHRQRYSDNPWLAGLTGVDAERRSGALRLG